MLNRLPQVIDATSSTSQSGMQTRAVVSSELSTPGFHQQSREATLKDRLLRCNRLSPNTELFQTSGLASISKDEAYSPYWTSQSKDDSSRLWCPTEIALLDMDSSLSSVSSVVTEPWLRCFTLKTMKTEPENSQRTCLQSLRFLQPDTMDDGEAPTERRCRKIRIYPTEIQSAMFNQMCDANRFFYNKANDVVKTKIQEAKSARMHEISTLLEQSMCCIHTSYTKAKTAELDALTPENKKQQTKIKCTRERIDGSYFCKQHSKAGSLGISYASFLTLPKLRPMVMKNDRDIPDGSADAWQKAIPYDCRQGAIKELLSAYSSAFTLKQNGHIDHFDIKFKTKKSPKQVFHCRANAFNAGTHEIFKTRLPKKGSKLRFRRRDVGKLVQGDDEEDHGDFTIAKVRPGAWYICLPRKQKEVRKPVYENAAYKSVFLDPGVRTFQTFYSPDGVCSEGHETGWWKLEVQQQDEETHERSNRFVAEQDQAPH